MRSVILILFVTFWFWKTPEGRSSTKTIIFFWLKETWYTDFERIRRRTYLPCEERFYEVEQISSFIDDNQEEVLLVIECKASHIDVRCNMVLDQLIRYRDVLDAEYIMLILMVSMFVVLSNLRMVDIKKSIQKSDLSRAFKI